VVFNDFFDQGGFADLSCPIENDDFPFKQEPLNALFQGSFYKHS
jgi:hypothetical protein